MYERRDSSYVLEPLFPTHTPIKPRLCVVVSGHYYTAGWTTLPEGSDEDRGPHTKKFRRVVVFPATTSYFTRVINDRDSRALLT